MHPGLVLNQSHHTKTRRTITLHELGLFCSVFFAKRPTFRRWETVEGSNLRWPSSVSLNRFSPRLVRIETETCSGAVRWWSLAHVFWGGLRSVFLGHERVYISLLCPFDGAANACSRAKTRAAVSLPLAFNWLMLMGSDHLEILSQTHTHKHEHTWHASDCVLSCARCV